MDSGKGLLASNLLTNGGLSSFLPQRAQKDGVLPISHKLAGKR